MADVLSPIGNMSLCGSDRALVDGFFSTFSLLFQAIRRGSKLGDSVGGYAEVIP